MPSSTTPTLSARDRRLRDRYGEWAVVTGASSGIGRALAVRLAAGGFRLVLVARSGPVLGQLAQELGERHGTECVVVAEDLGSEGGAARVVEAIGTKNVGLLVCGAGFGSSGRFIDSDVARECAMVDVNCRALLGLTWHLARRFAEQRRGGIILMSSIVAFQGVPLAANYAATKAYVQSLAEGLRLELAPLGVDVLACAPGPVHSGFAARAGMTMGKAAQPAEIAEETLYALGRRTTARPGWLSKLLGYSLATLPRSGRVRMMSMIMKGMAEGSKIAGSK